MSKRKKIMTGILAGVGLFLIATLAVWIIVGIKIEWGPFSFLAFDMREKAITRQYDADERQGEIIFYGASNFRLWQEMEEDMLPYRVQNHGFGGSTDQDLMDRADRLLYPYRPAIVVFQTGSNDCAKLSGTDEEIFSMVIERKIRMFELFHEKLPDAYFVVVSGILMPGRLRYDNIIKQVNQSLREYAAKTDYLYFVDSESMTVDAEGNHIAAMFISDGIHLTHESRIRWADDYIKPVLDRVLADHPELSHTRE